MSRKTDQLVFTNQIEKARLKKKNPLLTQMMSFAQVVNGPIHSPPQHHSHLDDQSTRSTKVQPYIQDNLYLSFD